MDEAQKLFDSVYTGLQIEEAIAAGLELRDDPQLALANLGGRPNRDLFDNAFFAGLTSGKFPVRQKGNTMDRWGNVSVTLDFLTDGVKVTSAGSDSYIVQKLENPSDFAGKTLTISAFIKDISVGAYIQLYAFNGSQYTVKPSEILTSDDICSATMVIPADTTLLFARLYTKPGGYATYVAAKCEEGDKQTLGWKDDAGIHLFETPDYGDTLVRCKRHLRSFNAWTKFAADYIDSGRIMFSIPGDMRADPVVSGFNLYTGVQLQSGFTFEAHRNGNNIVVAANKSGHGLTSAWLGVADKAYLSAEL